MKKPKIINYPQRCTSNGMLSFFNDVKASVESGKCEGIFVVGVMANGDVISGWHIDKGAHIYSLLGGVESTKKRFCEKEIE